MFPLFSFCNLLILSHGSIKDSPSPITVLLKAIGGVVYLCDDVLIYTAFTDLKGFYSRFANICIQMFWLVGGNRKAVVAK